MVVPARDEAAEIAAALRSKLSCGYPNLEVIAVDDRSTDQTAPLMRQIAATDSRLLVEQVRELPAGWLGKLNAMNVGVLKSTGEWLLFSDADVHVGPGVLERLIAHAEQNAVDFIAVLPGIDRSTPWVEATLVAFMRYVSVMARLWKVNDDRAKQGAGVGAFNLVRRSALNQSPGLEFLKLEVGDDMALGAMMKATGARCRLYVGHRDIHLQFFNDLGGVARSAEKSGTVFGFSWWKPLVASMALVGMELGTIVGAILGGGGAVAVGLAALLVATAVQVQIATWLTLPLRGVVCWPIGMVLMAVFNARAGIVCWRLQGIRWRDTFYPAEQLLAGRRVNATSLTVELPARHAAGS